MKPLWLGLGLVVVASLVYWGVSATSRDQDLSGENVLASEFAFQPWDSLTWSKAAAPQPALVFLLVSDSLSKRALDLESWLRSSSMAPTLAARFISIRVDRRWRPDLTERYAENQVPYLSVLLPTGEALSRLTGEPETWTEQLVETARYWNDHQSELHDRAEDFWQHSLEDSVGLPPTTPDLSLLANVDSAVFEVVNASLTDSSSSLWRTDLDRYLSARKTAAADSMHTKLRRVRIMRRGELNNPDTLEATRAEWIRTVLELQRYNGLDVSTAQLLAFQAAWSQTAPPFTAEEAALDVQQLLATGNAPVVSYPGTWLGLAWSTASLPHAASSAELDGYLTDALAWLETFLVLKDKQWLPPASRLADSIWANLWDPAHHALRDKPARTSYLREIPVYPRAQLGRAAALFDQLAQATGERRFSSRADSCLAGFAPYMQRAGAAATLYGEALLLRAGAS